MKKIAFGIWTAVIIIGAGLVIWGLRKDQISTGTDVTFVISDSQYMLIDGASVTMEAADDDFFAMREAGGEAIVVGEAQPKPLGWSGDTYFKAEPREVPGGTWLVENAESVTVHLVSEETMTVELVTKQGAKATISILMGFLFLLLWVLGIAIGA